MPISLLVGSLPLVMSAGSFIVAGMFAPRCVHVHSVWDRNTLAEHARGLNGRKMSLAFIRTETVQTILPQQLEERLCR